MKTLIALGGSVESLPILRRAKELGYRLVVVDGNVNAPGFELSDARLVSSCYHIETVDKLIEARHAGLRYDGVICAAIDAPHVAAAVASAFGLPGLSVEAAGMGADKWEQAKSLHKAGIPVPQFGDMELRPDGGGVKIFCHPSFNVLEKDCGTAAIVIKPRDSRGARGVVRVNPGDIFHQKHFDHARSQSPTGRVMVEEWLGGPQLSTESLVQDGKVLFTAVGLRNYGRLEEFAPYVVEDGFDEPMRVWDTKYGVEIPSVDYNVYINDLIEQSCASLNWFQKGGGVVKGDLVIHKGKLHVIELAPRLSGGLFCAAHELCYGVDFIGSAINMALGYTIDAPKSYPRAHISQRYVFPSRDDIGKRIVEYPKVLVADAGGREWTRINWHYSKPIGHVIQPVTAHPDRLGQALCVGATPQEARERAEAAVREMYEGMVIE